MAASVVSSTAPRGPSRLLCVVDMTTWAMPIGEGTTPAATRPPMCEMSARKYAPTSSAMARNFFQSGTQE